MIKRFKNLFSNKAAPRSTVTKPSMSNILAGLFKDLPVRREWLRTDAFARIERDDQVIASMGNRKAATLRKELIITTDDERSAVALRKVFRQDFIEQILDTPLQGMSVFELNYEDDEETNYWLPIPEELTFRNFVVKNRELRYDPYGSGTGESIVPNKAVYALHKPKHDRPMGTALANALFWPVKLKGASLEFWLRFLEKYGVPWTIGKTSGEREEMAQEIYNMLSGDAAVIDEDDSIETVVTQKVGDFDKLVSYCDNQIAKVILGANLTSDVKGGSLAAADTHMTIRDDLAMTDEHIVIEVLYAVIKSFREVNGISAKISVELKDKDDPNIELSLRDWRISLMGWQPTQEYLEGTYGIKVQPMPDKGSNPIANKKLGKLLHFSATKPGDAIDAGIGQIDTDPIAMTLQKKVLEILESSETFDEAFRAIETAYPGLEFGELEQLLSDAMMNADILAAGQVEEENPEG